MSNQNTLNPTINLASLITLFACCPSVPIEPPAVQPLPWRYTWW